MYLLLCWYDAMLEFLPLSNAIVAIFVERFLISLLNVNSERLGSSRTSFEAPLAWSDSWKSNFLNSFCLFEALKKAVSPKSEANKALNNVGSTASELCTTFIYYKRINTSDLRNFSCCWKKRERKDTEMMDRTILSISLQIRQFRARIARMRWRVNKPYESWFGNLTL